jgi:sugar/nucleoside kinase (ribokinase family)
MDAPWRGEVNGWVATLKAARAVGLETNLELPGVAPKRLAELVLPCLDHLDLLIVNDSEIGAIADISTHLAGETDVNACLRAATAVLSNGAMKLVAVHFPMGAVVVERGGAVLAKPSVHVPGSEFAGANGAGDAFTTGFLYGFHENWGTEKCLSLAHATAAASLRRITATGGVETWQNNLELAERWGWRSAP